MDEVRKRTLAIVASVFLTRKLAALDGKPSPAREMAFRESLELAEELMRRIERMHPPSKT